MRRCFCIGNNAFHCISTQFRGREGGREALLSVDRRGWRKKPPSCPRPFTMGCDATLLQSRECHFGVCSSLLLAQDPQLPIAERPSPNCHSFTSQITLTPIKRGRDTIRGHSHMTSALGFISHAFSPSASPTLTSRGSSSSGATASSALRTSSTRSQPSATTSLCIQLPGPQVWKES